MGDNVFSVLTEYKEVLAVIIPELIPTFTCKQNTVWHLYDVYTHTAKTVEQSQKNYRCALQCFCTTSENRRQKLLMIGE